MARDPIPAWFFVVVVVRLGRRYLLVQEAKHGNAWYLPAGRVEPGETLAAAARRETAEEGGIDIALEGLLRLEYEAHPDGGARVRVILLARPASDAAPKQQADDESLQAGWFTFAEARALRLRGADVIDALEQVEAGGPLLPIGCLQERS
jgi:8-oxo-dGTP pyrophosphatase MutT (NUDIX family)